MKVGLFFGSFNPITNGHLHIADMASEYVDEVWFVVSPHNPTKDPVILADQWSRFDMVKLAIDNPKYKAIDVEFNMPTPSYTYLTLEKLIKEYSHEFILIFGSDCVNSIHTWENGDWIMKTFPIIAFKREVEHIEPEVYKKLVSNSDISSTIIRNNITNGIPIENMLPNNVEQYIRNKGLWK